MMPSSSNALYSRDISRVENASSSHAPSSHASLINISHDPKETFNGIARFEQRLDSSPSLFPSRLDALQSEKYQATGLNEAMSAMTVMDNQAAQVLRGGRDNDVIDEQVHKQSKSDRLTKLKKGLVKAFRVSGKSPSEAKKLTKELLQNIPDSRKNNAFMKSGDTNKLTDQTNLGDPLSIKGDQLPIDDDFQSLYISENTGSPVYGPVNLEKRFDSKRWVTNNEEMIVYRQDNRNLDEILASGGFQPRSLELGTVEDHMLKPSGYTYISTSNTRLNGGSYGKYEYAIKLQQGQGINTDQYLKNKFGDMSRKPTRMVEYSVPGPISPEQIIGWKSWV
ncbi:hypothetical protein [Shewanella woodyi]|uniref:hypothetical protein n=1 Tax=Shewanella woodyi TaxID=60961 RepID=UPI003747F97C